MKNPSDDRASPDARPTDRATRTAKDKPDVLNKALARLVKTEPHLLWQRAKKLKPAQQQELLALAKKSDQVQCHFYAAVAPKGLATLGAFHCGLDGYDQRMRALAKLKINFKRPEAEVSPSFGGDWHGRATRNALSTIYLCLNPESTLKLRG